MEVMTSRANDFGGPVKVKKRKVRSAWISFAGRIAAQLIGAAATVALGVVVFGARDSAHAAAPIVPTAYGAPSVQGVGAHSVLVAKQVRTQSGTVVILVPLDRFAEVTDQMVEEVSAALLTNLSQDGQPAVRLQASHARGGN